MNINIAKHPKNDGYQRVLASMVYKLFDKKSSGSGVKSEIKRNQQLSEELPKPLIRKFENKKVHSSFKYNIWGADIVDMQWVSNFNKRFRFLLCVIDIYSKLA